jgi:hypothetical protein
MIKEATDVISIGKASFGQGTIEGKTSAYRSVAIGTDTFKGQKAASTIENSIAIGYKAGYHSGSHNICIGANADTFDQNIENVIIVGENQRVSNSNEMRFGNKNIQTIVLGNKLLKFNEDGSITWEYSKTKSRYKGSANSNDTYDQWVDFDGSNKLYIGSAISITINSLVNSGDTNGWIFVIKPIDTNAIYVGVDTGKELSYQSEIEYIQVYHKKGTGSGSIEFDVISIDKPDSLN